MDIKTLQRAIVDGLEDVKAQEIKVFDTTHLTSLFDRVVIASGTSNRQTRALAASVAEKVREAGFRVASTEGGETGEWVLVDCGDAVVHIMQPALRQYYNLEEIWGGKAVRLAKPSLAPTRDIDETTTLDQDPSADPAAKKAKKAPVKRAAAKKAGAGTPAGATRKTAPRKTSTVSARAPRTAAAGAPAKTARKTAGASVARKTGGSSGSSGKPSVKRATARKTPGTAG